MMSTHDSTSAPANHTSSKSAISLINPQDEGCSGAGGLGSDDNLPQSPGQVLGVDGGTGCLPPLPPQASPTLTSPTPSTPRPPSWQRLTRRRASRVEQLHDEAYEVVKVNYVGFRLNRTLRLLRETVENVRPSTGGSADPVVTCSIRYSEIASVHLLKADRFCLSRFEQGDQDLIYESPIAPQLVEKLLHRCRLALAPLPTLSDAELETLAQSLARDRMVEARQFVQSCRLSPSGQALKPGTVDKATAGSKRAAKLQHMTGESEAQRITVFVKKMVYDEDGVEGRSRAHFLATFNPAQGLEPLRRYMDAFHYHIMETRKDELRRLVIQTRIDDDSAGVQESRVAVSLKQLGADNTRAAAASADSVTVSRLVMQTVEEAMLLPLLEPLRRSLLPTDADKAEERDLVARIDHLYSTQPEQAYYGIPPELVSPGQWANASRTLAKADDDVALPLPGPKLELFFETVRAIYVEHLLNQCSARGGGGEEMTPLTGDDLLPIFVYVLIRSRLRRPLCLRALLTGLCSADTLRGEGGYYLTVFEAAIEYIKSLELEADEGFLALSQAQCPPPAPARGSYSMHVRSPLSSLSSHPIFQAWGGGGAGVQSPAASDIASPVTSPSNARGGGRRGSGHTPEDMPESGGAEGGKPGAEGAGEAGEVTEVTSPTGGGPKGLPEKLTTLARGMRKRMGSV